LSILFWKNFQNFLKRLGGGGSVVGMTNLSKNYDIGIIASPAFTIYIFFAEKCSYFAIFLYFLPLLGVVLYKKE